MPQTKVMFPDFEALEAEIALMLTDHSLPMEKRSELKARLEAIRAKAGRWR